MPGKAGHDELRDTLGGFFKPGSENKTEQEASAVPVIVKP
jgi:hypothetical protein